MLAFWCREIPMVIFFCLVRVRTLLRIVRASVDNGSDHRAHLCLLLLPSLTRHGTDTSRKNLPSINLLRDPWLRSELSRVVLELQMPINFAYISLVPDSNICHASLPPLILYYFFPVEIDMKLPRQTSMRHSIINRVLHLQTTIDHTFLPCDLIHPKKSSTSHSPYSLQRRSKTDPVSKSLKKV